MSHITNIHIQHGCPSQYGSCPIAMALNESGFINVKVLSTKFTHFSPYTVIDLPPVVIDFIKSFDNGQVVKPFEFEI